MIYARRFRSDGHTMGFRVERDPQAGWSLREEEDDQLVRLTRCHDWQRVERMTALFQLKASALEQDGWEELPVDS